MSHSSHPKNGRPANDITRLRRQVRALVKETRVLREERDAYLQALMTRWKKESRPEEWRDFNPADYRFTMAEILAEFEKEEGVCLTRLLTTSSTPSRSARASKTSSAGRKKRGN